MSAPTILIPKHAALGQGFSRRERALALEHPGRRTDGRQSAASWIADLTDLRKLILLCSFCQGKFNPRRHGYRVFYTPDPTSKTDGYVSNGICDACKARTELSGGGRAYIAEDTYRLTCVDPLDARRQARLAWRRQTVWGWLRRQWGSRRPRDAAAGG